MKRVFPTIIDLVALLGIFFLIQIFVTLGSAVVGVDLAEIAELMEGEIEATVAQQQMLGRFLGVTYAVTMGLMILVTLWYRRARHGRGPVVKLSAKGFNPTILLWGFVMMTAASVVVEPLITALPMPPMDMYGRGVWALLSLVVMAPLFEEFLCRGIILESARTKYGAAAAVFISAAFFGVMHGYPAMIINAFVVGLVFGFVYVQSRSLLSTVILHALNNGIAYLFLMLGMEHLTMRQLVGNPDVYLVMYVVCVAILVASGVLIYRQMKKSVPLPHEETPSE